MTLYLEQYLDSLQGLPIELRRNLELLGEWDAESQKKLRKINVLVKEFAANCRESGRGGWSREVKSRKYQEIKDLFRNAQLDGDNKVSVANQTYELVDKHIRKLDGDLARFEADIKRRFLGGIQSDTEDAGGNRGGGGRGRKTPKKLTKTVAKSTAASEKKSGKKRKLEEQETPSTSKKGRKKSEKASTSTARANSESPVPMSTMDQEELAQLSGPALFQKLAGGDGDVMDMPVDPNEPTYCLCHQVSYGEMVGCDNQDCPIEWFHFACVNLTSKPKGKWYCPRCTEERKKKKVASNIAN